MESYFLVSFVLFFSSFMPALREVTWIITQWRNDEIVSWMIILHKKNQYIILDILRLQYKGFLIQSSFDYGLIIDFPYK